MAVMWAYFKVMKPWRELRLCLQNLNLQEGRKIMEKRFEKVSAKFRKELEKDIKMTIIKNFQKEMVEEDFYKYEVQLQSFKFVTYMTNKELEKSIELTIDLLEELKNINNGGLDARMLQEKVRDVETKYQEEALQQISILNEIYTDKIYEIIGEINVIRRVGGAYAMLVSNPCFNNAIYVVYERLVDNFNDEELYCFSAYFLVRAVMRINSDEIGNA